MCTIIDCRLPRIALRPIKCYKVILKCGDGFCSPYQHKTVILNSYQKAEGKIIFNDIFSRYLDKGVIHSFVFRHDAAYLQRDLQIMWLNHCFKKSYFVIECYIPRFTIYWKGTFSFMDTYCSKKIFFKEIIDYPKF